LKKKITIVFVVIGEKYYFILRYELCVPESNGLVTILNSSSVSAVEPVSGQWLRVATGADIQRAATITILLHELHPGLETIIFFSDSDFGFGDQYLLVLLLVYNSTTTIMLLNNQQ